jgi:hypothetical protein
MNSTVEANEEQCITCSFPEWLNFFNPFKSRPEKFMESVELYEYSMDVLFIHNLKTVEMPTTPVEMEGYECHSLGGNMTVVRKVSDNIQLLLIFEDIYKFGDTHKLVDGTMYFNKKKYTVKEFNIHHDITIGEKKYEYMVECLFE